jgi:hypothetical protein
LTAVTLLRSAKACGMAPMKWPIPAEGSRVRPPVKPKRSTACHMASIMWISVSWLLLTEARADA